MLLHYAITVDDLKSNEGDIKEGDGSKGWNFRPELMVELYRGQLLVTFRYQDYKEEIAAAKGMYTVIAVSYSEYAPVNSFSLNIQQYS